MVVVAAADFEAVADYYCCSQRRSDTAKPIRRHPRLAAECCSAAAVAVAAVGIGEIAVAVETAVVDIAAVAENTPVDIVADVAASAVLR